MTNSIERNEINARRLTALATTASFILESDDMLAALDALRELMTPIDFDALCFSTDICPMHMTDTDTCADDDLDECRNLR